VEERAEAKGSGAAWCKHGCTDEETPQRLTPWRDLRAAQIHHDGRREGRNRPREHRLIKGKQQRWLWASSVGCPRVVWWWWRDGREGTQLEMTGCWARRWPRADQRDQAHPPRREERRMGHRNDSVAWRDHRHGLMNGQLCVARRPLPRRANKATLRPIAPPDAEPAPHAASQHRDRQDAFNPNEISGIALAIALRHGAIHNFSDRTWTSVGVAAHKLSTQRFCAGEKHVAM